jgi:hypothetical protein
VTGIFCLEGGWQNDFDSSSSVKAVLELVSQGAELEFVHRDVATREELAHYLGKWAQRGARRYPILYLAFHGGPGRFLVGDRRRTGHKVTLDDLATILGGGLRGRLVHFGSCSTLDVDRRHISRFLRQTGVLAATGFKKEVDWLRSSAFEVLVFETLLRHRLTLGGARRMERAFRREVPDLRREFQFRMVINEPRSQGGR